MGVTLTAEAFTRLLARLATERERAGEKYEELRGTLIRFFEWRGAPFPEDHADETFNRIAQKLNDGVEIINFNGYCHEVARRVCLEIWKGNESRRAALPEEQLHNTADTHAADSAPEKERLLECLEECLERLPVESRTMLFEYYQNESGRQIRVRKALAEALGLQREALANRVQRLRDKLEKCVMKCFQRKSAT